MLRQKLTLSALVVSALLLGAPAALNAQYAISTVAGGGPNGLLATSSSIGFPGGVARDGSGNTYISDVNSSRVFKIDSTTGTLTVFAGNESGIGGEGGYSGDGGPATSAQLGRPHGITVDTIGDVFIADTDNSVIRCVAAATGGCFNATLAAGSITTVAGVYNPSTQCNAVLGDGGLATSAQLCRPAGVFVDGSSNIFIADTDNSLIREVLATTGDIKTVAGGGSGCTGQTDSVGDGCAATSAQLALPNGVFVDGSGDIFIADTDNSVIREVTAATGIIQTVAGEQYVYGSMATPTCQYSGDTGLATAAQLCLPSGVSVDSSGDIFIADTNNSVIREVVAATGDIQPVAGNNTLGAGYSGDGGAATSAQLDFPFGLFVDSLGNLFIADTDNFVIREVSGGTQTIATIAGNHTIAYSGDGEPPTDASLYASGGVFVDGLGNLFIADTYNNAIREIAAGSNIIQTVAGGGSGCTGQTDSIGDGCAATSAQLNDPFGVFVDSQEDIFIADTEDSVIRCVVGAPLGCFGSALLVGSITTVAGTGTAGPTGDGGPATSAELSSPRGVYMDSAGDLFIADTENSRIRCVAGAVGGCFTPGLAIGSITTVAGSGSGCAGQTDSVGDGCAATSAQLNFPAGVSGDNLGNLFIADTLDSKIREVVAATGVIQTVAGGGSGCTLQTDSIGDGCAATSAQLNDPYGVYVDNLGNLFIADTDNTVVREVVAATGFIQTIAGNGTEGYSGDGGPADSAQLANPLSVIGNGSGNLYVADTENSRIRELTSTVSIVLVPTSATLPAGASQQFSATVAGASDLSTTWQVNGVTGGNSTVGTISDLGLYQAPMAAPPPATVTVTAIANANGMSSVPATVTIVSSTTAAITLSTDPAVTAVYTGATQTILANVTNSAGATVNWQVNGVPGGNTTVGTISTAGLYSAPAAVPSPATVVIGAALAANPSVSASYPITIVAPPVAPAPAAQTISSGGSALYAIALQAKTGLPGQVMTLSCLQSSLPSNATCTFTPPTITPGSSAVPFSLKVNTAVCVAALERPNGTLLASRHFLFFLPAAAILLAGWDKRKKRWLRPLMLVLLCAPLALLVSCGGSGGSQSASCTTPSGVYQVKVQGTTPAQPNPVTIVTVTLTVQ
jgi:NHL repeat-containing protein